MSRKNQVMKTNENVKQNSNNERTSNPHSSFQLKGISDVKSLSPSNLLQMQSTLGNQVVQRMINNTPAVLQRAPEDDDWVDVETPSEDGEWVDVETPEQAESEETPMTRPRSGAVFEAPPVTRPRSGAMIADKSPVLMQACFNWLESQAEEDGKTTLYSFFDELPALEKAEAVKIMSDKEAPTVDDLIEKMKPKRFLRKDKFNWDKFSEAARQAKGKSTVDDNALGVGDYAEYGSLGAGVGMGAAGGIAKGIHEKIDSGIGAGSAAKEMSPYASGIGVGGAGVQIANAVANHDQSLGTHDMGQNIVGQGLAGAADLSQTTSDTVGNVQGLAASGASAGAIAAAGASGVIGGTFYLASGLVGSHVHGNRETALTNQTETAEAALASGGLSDQEKEEKQQLAMSAHLASSTQNMNKNKSRATALKGAAMLAGGILVLTSTVTPIGPLIIAVAGAIGGVVALRNYLKKKDRQTELLDKYLKVSENLQKNNMDPDKNDMEKDEMRTRLLEKNGFNSEDQCYAHIVHDMAVYIHDQAINKDNVAFKDLIENMGLTINKEKGLPKVELIAKKLDS